jgi:hypothetical protein
VSAPPHARTSGERSCKAFTSTATSYARHRAGSSRIKDVAKTSSRSGFWIASIISVSRTILAAGGDQPGACKTGLYNRRRALRTSHLPCRIRTW